MPESWKSYFYILAWESFMSSVVFEWFCGMIMSSVTANDFSKHFKVNSCPLFASIWFAVYFLLLDTTQVLLKVFFLAAFSIQMDLAVTTYSAFLQFRRAVRCMSSCEKTLFLLPSAGEHISVKYLWKKNTVKRELFVEPHTNLNKKKSLLF